MTCKNCSTFDLIIGCFVGYHLNDFLSCKEQFVVITAGGSCALGWGLFFIYPLVFSSVRLPVFNLRPALSLKVEGGLFLLVQWLWASPTSVCTTYYLASGGSWGNLCTNSMFQQRLLICVMSVVGRENAHFLVIPFSSSHGGTCKDFHGECYETLAVFVDGFLTT